MMRRVLLCFCVSAASLLSADVTGIWSGLVQGQRGEPQDVAFRFKVEGQALTGKMFGDEFDLPISDGSLTGEQIHFTVVTKNYYNGGKTVFTYTGTFKGTEMELTRERVPNPDDKGGGPNRGPGKQTIKLKRIG
jgi:hypothetical protein